MNDTYITLAGWVGSDVTLREVTGGHQVASFRVAHRARRLKQGQWVDGETTWYQVKAWRRLAEHVAGSLKVGDPVVVHGRFVADVWNREDGTSLTQLVVTATSVGHDLSRCTTTCVKPQPASVSADEMQPASQEPVTTVSATAEASSDPWAVPMQSTGDAGAGATEAA